MADRDQLDLFARAAARHAARKRASQCVPPVRVGDYRRGGRTVAGYNRRCPLGRALTDAERRHKK